jgi:hypothetical protein
MGSLVLFFVSEETSYIVEKVIHMEGRIRQEGICLGEIQMFPGDRLEVDG